MNAANKAEGLGASTAPKCPTHAAMVSRPTAPQSAEQKFCGEWFDCPACHNSVLVPSPALLAQLASQASRQRTLFSSDSNLGEPL